MPDKRITTQQTLLERLLNLRRGKSTLPGIIGVIAMIHSLEENL
jgi:hypothetical protein